MGAKEKRARYKEEFRREILHAARDFFINEGYEKFSMRKLAEKIEYPPTTIHLYFKDKDDLLFAICEEVAGHFFADLTKIRTAHSDPLESLRQALLYLIEFRFDKPDEYKLFFITSPKVYGTLDDFMEKKSMARNSYFVFREIVRNCIATGKLQEIDIDVLAQVLTVATHGLAALTIYKTSFPWLDRNVLAHTLVEGLLRGYRK
ncbi:MAG: TetR/AcrR family transcriptional regulator [Dissulfurispiraceae bacterium]|jgi:AcrR family transcriptional regulator